MSDTATDWLPKTAFTEDVIRAALSGPVGDWSVRWFADHRAELSGVRLLEVPDAAEAKGMRLNMGAVSASLTDHARRHLLNALLDVELADSDVGDGDHAVLAALVVDVVQDLAGRLDRDLRGEKQTRNDALAFDVAVGKSLLTITLPAHTVVSPIKARLGGPRRGSTMPQHRRTALGPVRVMADALLGSAELRAQDLKELAAGDVLILDRVLDEPIALRLAGREDAFAHGRLGRNGQHVAVEL